MSYQCRHEVYAKWSETREHKRRIPTNKTHPTKFNRSMATTTVFTRSMAASAVAIRSMANSTVFTRSMATSTVFTRSMITTDGPINADQTMIAGVRLNDSELKVLKKFTNTFIDKTEKLQMMLKQQDEKLKSIYEQNSNLNKLLTRTEDSCTEINVKIKNPLNELLSSSVSPTCSSNTDTEELSSSNHRYVK